MAESPARRRRRFCGVLAGKMPTSRRVHRSLMKPLVALALPGMYLVYKYNQFKRQQQETSRRKVTEKELHSLNQKIDKLLAKLDEHDGEGYSISDEEECVVCLCAKATMQTFPCGHKVVCRKCFVKTIQVAVSQRCLPLKCVVCRTRVLKLKQSGEEAISPPSSRATSGSKLFARLFSSSGRSSQQQQQQQQQQQLGQQQGQQVASGAGNSHQAAPGAGSGHVSRHSQPVVATKLMQPWLIYPSGSSPKQQRAFSGAEPAGASSSGASPAARDIQKDVARSFVRLHTSGPFSPAERRPRHHCNPVTSSRMAELKHAHMLSPRVPRCSQCLQQQQQQQQQQRQQQQQQRGAAPRVRATAAD